MSLIDALEEVREQIYRASTERAYDEALDHADKLIDAVQGSSATVPEVRMAFRTALVSWRYTYYRGTDASLRKLPSLEARARRLRELFSEGEDRLAAEVGFSCTAARIARNRGNLALAERLLASVRETPRSSRSAAQLELELGCVARYRKKFSEAIEHYRAAGEHVESPHGRVALVHYFAAAGCEIVLDTYFSTPTADRDRFSEFNAAVASLRRLSDPRALSRAKRYPHQYAYIRKHEAMIHALSGHRSAAEDVLREASEVMNALGSRKGRALIAYSSAVVYYVLKDARRAQEYCDRAIEIAGGYYPPGVDRSKELKSAIEKKGTSQRSLPEDDRLLRLAAAWTPVFMDVLVAPVVDPATSDWARSLLQVLTGDEAWTKDLLARVLNSPSLLERYWDARSTSQWHEAVFESIATEYGLDRMKGRHPGHNSAGGRSGGLIEELVAYRGAGISQAALDRILAISPSDLAEVERVMDVLSSGGVDNAG